MLKKILGFILVVVISTSSYANDYTYEINFSTDKNYVDSLNNLRVELGRSLNNIDYRGTGVFELPPQSSEIMEGLIIQVSGIDAYGDDSKPDLQFVINRRNLYVAGFITRGVFYRFNDMQNTTLSGYPLVVLRDNSDYITLQRIANLNRNNMQINRSNLTSGYYRLTQFTENNVHLDESSARALLRYLTVIPEAIRFRQIQRNFRVALAREATDYIVSSDDVTITNSWSGLSSVLHDVDAQTAPGVRVGTIALPDAFSIVAMIAVVLSCSKNKSKNSFLINDSFDKCSRNDSVVINHIVWARSSVVSAIDI